MYFIEVEPNVRLCVQEFNPKGEHTIVLVHGWPLNRRMFEYQLNVLPARGWRCIAYDLRGFGDSDTPVSGYGYDRLADDLRIVVDALGLTQFVLTGFSVGGAIVTRYMARHAGYGVQKLALLAAASPSFVQRPSFPYGMTVEAVNSLISQTYRDRPQMLEGFGRLFFASNVTPALRVWFNGLGLAASGIGTIRVLESLRDEDLHRDLASIHVPTGIFHGVRDQICPFELAVAQHNGIAGSVLYRFENSGHAVFYDELERFNDTFFAFLEG
ncbi:MAG: alpha/beta hydrolase [Ethanoligenens sp.]